MVSVAIGAGISQSSAAQDQSGHLLTVYDRGATRSFIATTNTIGEALNQEGFVLSEYDRVEPAIDEELIGPVYEVNIYRARPVIIEDGPIRIRTVSAYQTAKQIVQDLGLSVQPEDLLIVKRSRDILYDGAGLVVSIGRARQVEVEVFGRPTTFFTQADTVEEFLIEKGISLSPEDGISVSKTTNLTSGMRFRIWREGSQTITLDEPVAFPYDIVYDADRPLGYREVQTKGRAGVQAVTYAIEVREGIEVARTELARVTTTQPTRQIEVIGLYNSGGGLTKNKGAQIFVDSKGVAHRETYYDLPMNIVMRGCGQGGFYTVRPDGAKVDANGYVIIAANYARYPRCSIVETSLGPAKVYDTGGFAAVHPDGFDLATDWTNNNGL